MKCRQELCNMSSDYQCNDEFIADLVNAKAGCVKSQHKIWEKICFKQVKYKSEDWAVAYESFLIAIDKADFTKLTQDSSKKAYYVFAKLFKIRLFKHKRLDFFEHGFPVKITENTYRSNKVPDFVCYDDYMRSIESPDPTYF